MADNGSSLVAFRSDSHYGAIDEPGIDGSSAVDLDIFGTAEMGVIGDDGGLAEESWSDLGLKVMSERGDFDE